LGKLAIESEALKSGNAGEDLAADTARAEEPEWGIALRSPVSYTQRRDGPGRTSERLRRPFLRNTRVIIGLEETPEWTWRRWTGYRGVDGARDLETIAAICWLLAGFAPEVIAHVLA
jgi:hypothetical protein